MDLNYVGIALGILGIVITLIIGWFGTIYFQRKFENDTLKKRISELEEEVKAEKRKNLRDNVNTELPQEYRNINNDKDLLIYANRVDDVSEVKILGINGLGPVHRGREEIIKCLEKGKQVKVLLLNPYSRAFIDRIIEVECKRGNITEDYESHLERLTAEFNATLKILKNIEKSASSTNGKGLLQVRMRSEKPTFAFTALQTGNKEGIALINNYPDQGRGIEGGQDIKCEIVPKQKVGYMECIDQFDEYWKNAQEVPSFINIRYLCEVPKIVAR